MMAISNTRETTMPEFILDMGSPNDARRFNALDDFTQGYVEAMFFTEMEHGTDSDSWNPEEHSSLPGDVTFADLSQTALATMGADCARFQERNATLLDAARALEPGSAGFRYGRDALNDKRLGQLFWYARNGHGVSFCDDGDADCLRTLQRIAQACGGRWVTFGDDDMIYVT
jgi:hypothetical protein